MCVLCCPSLSLLLVPAPAQDTAQNENILSPVSAQQAWSLRHSSWSYVDCFTWIWQWAENILYATVTLKIRISSRLFKRSCKPSCQTQTFIFPTPIPCSPEQVPAQLIMMIRLLLQKTPPPVYMHRWRWMCESPVKDSQKVMYAHFSLMNKWTNQLERGDVLKLSHPYRIQFMGCWKKVVQLLAKGSND